MLGISFIKNGNFTHTFTDWNLVPKTRFHVSPAEPKYNQIELAGSDAIIDLTESLTGYVCFKMRKCEMTFSIVGNRSEWSDIYSTIQNYLQGEHLQVIADEDPEWYWTGRFEVSDWDTVQKIGEITISGTVEPYKLKVEGADHEFNLFREGGNYCQVTGSKKHVVPVFEYTNASAGEGNIYLVQGTDETVLIEGDNRFPEIVIGEGTHLFHFRVEPETTMYVATINIRFDIGSL